MEYLLKWWGGYVLVELSGYSPERLLNLCGYNGIELWDLICVDGTYRFYVRRSDFKQLISFVRKSKTRLIVLEKCGLPFWIHHHRKRKWFAMGIVLCALLMYVLSLHIWEIRFEGNSYFTDEVLIETLQEQGYDTGMRKGQIVCDDLEMMLRETYPEITWVSAQINGTRLCVQIRENMGILNVEEAETGACDLVADYDGVITEIITRSGTPLVKAGDQVKAGQVLVRGVVELYNDSKEKIGQHLVQADADIFAQTTIEYEDHVALEYPVKWYTGAEQYQVTIFLFGKKVTWDPRKMIPMFLKESNWGQRVSFLRKYTVYDAVSIQDQLILGESIVFPVRWQLNTLREYEEVCGLYSEAQAISIAEENCARFFENLLEKGVQIIEKNVRIDMMGNECVAQGTVTVIRRIGQAVPIAQNTGDQEETSN